MATLTVGFRKHSRTTAAFDMAHEIMAVETSHWASPNLDCVDLRLDLRPEIPNFSLRDLPSCNLNASLLTNMS